MQSQTIPSSLLVFLADSIWSSGRIPHEINFARLEPSRRIDIMRSGHSTTQTVRYWRMFRVSDTADDENRKTCRPIPVAGPMRHDGEVCSAQFSADGQRVMTASGDKTARVWDAPVIRNQDAPDDVLLLADLAEAACGSVLQTSGQTEILKLLPPDQVRATREKIAAVHWSLNEEKWRVKFVQSPRASQFNRKKIQISGFC